MNREISIGEVVQAAGIGLGVLTIFACAGSGSSTDPGSLTNAKKISTASFLYSNDFDNVVVLSIDGDFGAMTNVDNKANSGYLGLPRTDGWPLLLLPYHNNRQIYVDPVRGDVNGIWSAPASASAPSSANTWRSQSRFPMYGLNYLYLSPFFTDLSDPSFPMTSRGNDLDRATEPAQTLMFLESKRWADTPRGWFSVGAPCAFRLALTETTIWWDGTPCAGDWCGAETDPAMRQQTFHTNAQGGNVAFVDGHASYMTAAQVAAGTSYSTAVRDDNGTGGEGGSTIEITDKSKYLWNLDNDYMGLDQPSPAIKKGAAPRLSPQIGN